MHAAAIPQDPRMVGHFVEDEAILQGFARRLLECAGPGGSVLDCGHACTWRTPSGNRGREVDDWDLYIAIWNKPI